MEILNKHPELAKQIQILCQTRNDEILSHMLEKDNEYRKLCKKRADTSMALKKSLNASDSNTLFEAYSDAVCAQESYELDAVYKQAVYDVLDTLQNLKLLL